MLNPYDVIQYFTLRKICLNINEKWLLNNKLFIIIKKYQDIVVFIESNMNSF